jgi:mono/diheme cytochrome c family protein
MRHGLSVLVSSIALACFTLFGAGCPPQNEDPAVARGRQAYMGTCIACHNMNPALDGAIGPAVKGAPPPLLEAKILRGAYPDGYKPKRDTKVMPPQPAMANSIADLAAFLNAP